MKAKLNYSNIKAFIQGHVREWLFYHKRLNILIPLHIFEQINYRLFVMKKECYTNGECVHCGCTTPALQMADKVCGGKCYPEMMDDTNWHIFKQRESIIFNYWNRAKPREFELRIYQTTKKL
jgi:hypothetical protein